MSDVFISYSRQNQPFVRQLFDQLERSGQDPWVDWDGIPLSANWWKTIKDGIDAANTVVFIMSPDSLASPTCHLEIAYARYQEKRILPVLHREGPIETAFGVIAARKPDAVQQAILSECRPDERDLLLLARNNWSALRGHLKNTREERSESLKKNETKSRYKAATEQ